jgi:tricorn protease-like protein
MISSASPSFVPTSHHLNTLGLFDNHSDVGAVKIAGFAEYSGEQQEYTIAGAGTNMWLQSDQFYFAWKRMKGNFIVQAQANFIGQGVDEHRKLGWIARTSLEADATHINAVVHGDGLTSLQFRRSVGGPTEEVRSALSGADIIQLERRGNTYIMSVARFGQTFVTTEVSELDLGDEVYVGLFVCSHNEDMLEKAVFRNVRIIVPTGEGFVPYRDYLGSNLEVLKVETGQRQIIHQSTDCFEAPNWTPDGKALIYNSKGRLYRFDLDRKTPEVIDTGFAIKNNNDHVLSFDGTMIGISHHNAEDENQSIVYVLPVEGGEPKRVTDKGPSYLHGWSPDGCFLVYTGARDGNYDIYKIAVDGGAETRLTTAPGLDDGSEYSPDGRYIYFNSVRSGSMQIWRMKPDGSEQEQITSDEYNNWFPHISPDGQWIVFLSYSREVDPSSHPYYKQVYLRLMPVSGGEPKVIAYVYGGQGTINVPSWSPDSKSIAFVSNTDMK